MVTGIESFKIWFKYYQDQYAIIDGTACDILMEKEGLDFRATKDIDLVLIVESIDRSFGNSFWKYIKEAEYKHCGSNTGNPQFYRFSHPKSSDYPAMIELFSIKPDCIKLPENVLLTPLQ